MFNLQGKCWFYDTEANVILIDIKTKMVLFSFSIVEYQLLSVASVALLGEVLQLFQCGCALL